MDAYITTYAAAMRHESTKGGEGSGRQSRPNNGHSRHELPVRKLSSGAKDMAYGERNETRT